MGGPRFSGLSLATLRWAQTAGYGFVPNERMPNTFMAVATDMPDHDSPYGMVHTRHKQDIGLRLGLAARGAVYGADVAWQTPRPTGATSADGDVTVVFDLPLAAAPAEESAQFEVCQLEPCAMNATEGWVSASIKQTGEDSLVIQTPSLKNVGEGYCK